MKMNNKLMIGVLGAGTMGNGIAHVFALHKYSVILVDVNKSILNELAIEYKFKLIENISLLVQAFYKLISFEKI